MNLIIGPILKQAGGYVFDTWSACDGISRGYPYRRIEDASYARNAIIRTCQASVDIAAVACHTVDEFMVRVSDGTVLAAA